MSNRGTDDASEAYQRDQAEGERDDALKEKVTRGPHGADKSTRQQSVAERDPAEGSRSAVDQ